MSLHKIIAQAKFEELFIHRIKIQANLLGTLNHAEMILLWPLSPKSILSALKFNYAFNKWLLSSHYVRTTLIGTGHIAVNKIGSALGCLGGSVG